MAQAQEKKPIKDQEKKPITALEIAKSFCALSNWQTSNLRLHKCLYIAHMIMLGEQGRPLINVEKFEAWRLGPVLKDLYHHCKSNFDNYIKKETFKGIDRGWEDKYPVEFGVLEAVYDLTKKFSPIELVHITHREKGAWNKNYGEGNNNYIPNEDILKEYHQWPQKK